MLGLCGTEVAVFDRFREPTRNEPKSSRTVLIEAAPEIYSANIKEKSNMQDDKAYQSSFSTSDQSSCGVNGNIASEAHDAVGEFSATESNLRSIMGQNEMETLTSWFPRSAQALAGILRARARQVGN